MITSLPLANVMLAYHIPYVMVLFLCFVVLPIEYFVFWLFQKIRPFHSLKVMGQIILANIASLVAGYLISAFIPSTKSMAFNSLSKEYTIGVFFGFIFAFFISWFIEYHVMCLLNKKTPFPKLAKTIGYANMVSYFVVYVVTFVLVLFG